MKNSSTMLILQFVLLLVNLFSSGGFYSSGAFFCRTSEACTHEIAHKIDFENGHLSNSEEFSHAVTLYIMVEFKKDRPSDLSINMVGFMDSYKSEFPSFSSTPEELYAMIYQWVGGDISKIPESLQKFYINEYDGLYDCLMTGERIKVCGTAIYISK